MSDPLTARAGQLLSLGLRHGDALATGGPVSKAQVDLVLRLRAQRQFKGQLPPPTDEFSLSLRTRLLEEAELREWKVREQAIRDIQEQRIDLIKAALEKYISQDIKARVDRKIDTLRDRADLASSERADSLETLRAKALRRIVRNRAKAADAASSLGFVDTEKKLNSLAVKAYTDYSSCLYTPLARLGKIPRQGSGAVDILISELSSARSLEAIAARLERPRPRPAAPTPTDPGKQKILALAYSLARREASLKAKAKAAVVAAKVQIEEPVAAPAEPPAEPPAELAAATEDRLRELEVLEAGNDNEDMQSIQDALEPDDAELLRLIADEDATDAAVGEQVSAALDGLSKELTRLKEERRVSCLVWSAMRERRLREAAEQGRRQIEECKRAREDELFRQVMQVNHETVDSFLSEIIEQSVAAVNLVAELPVPQGSDSEPQAVADTVGELISTFLLPHVDRECVKRRTAERAEQSAQAAKDALLTAIALVEENLIQEEH